jgi:hypothetical protein|tara:strand:+ start:2559 stop:4211 length:1653 start_codon:yes stop_codon:yes gene_type:complete
MATRAASRDAARAQSTRSGRVPQALIDELIRPGLGQKDVRLRSVGPNARLQEARRRLNDPETTAGKPGTNLCRYAGDDTKMAGKRPSYYTEKRIGRAGMSICKSIVDEAWSDPAFLTEQKRVCGENREYVFPHARKNGVRVKGHCRNLHAPRPRAKKPKADPRQAQLNALIRKRDATQNLTKYNELNRQIKALRVEMKPQPVQTEPDDISGFDFSSVRPKSKRPVLTEPDDISAYDFSSVRPKKPVRPVSKPNAAMRDYIDSLPRGSKKRATDAFRVYMSGPERYTADQALSAYKLMLSRDGQVVGDTAFDDSGDEDQDIGEFEPGGGGLDGGALTAGLQVLIDDREWSAANPQLYERLIDRMGMARGDEISKRTGEIGPMKEKAEREMIANAAAAAERSRHTAASTAFKHLAFTDPSRDSIGIFGSPGTPASTAPMDTPGTPAFPMGNSPFAGTQQQQAAMAAWQHVYPASPAGSAPSVPSISTEGFPTPSSFDSDATQPGGAGAPEGYHYMDDGTLMSDAAHLTGAPESYHLMADDMRGNGLTLFATH